MSESDTPQNVEKTVSEDPTASAPVRFLGQYIKDLSFEVPNTPDIYNLLRQKAPDIPISLETSAQHINAGLFEVKLSVSLRATVEDKTAFILELVYGCLAEVNSKSLPEEHVHPFLHIEVPRQMFPFVRQIVSDMTVGGGFPPLLLQIVDFNEIYRKKFAGTAQPSSEAGPSNGPVESPAADSTQTTT
tara:strand:+ start:4527 stop:5090 length:564 start_codon:yes stop_codon:yes gene_type:complete